jgi:hypothetical protein
LTCTLTAAYTLATRPSGEQPEPGDLWHLTTHHALSHPGEGIIGGNAMFDANTIQTLLRSSGITISVKEAERLSAPLQAILALSLDGRGKKKCQLAA